MVGVCLHTIYHFSLHTVMPDKNNIHELVLFLRPRVFICNILIVIETGTDRLYVPVTLSGGCIQDVRLHV